MAIASMIMSIVLPILKHTWTYILVLVIAFVCWHKFKNWMQYPEPDPVATKTVVGVESPTLIQVQHGLLGRRQEAIPLWGLEVPKEQYEDALNQIRSYVQEGDLILTEKKGSYYKIVSRGVYVNKELILKGNAKLNQADDELLDAQEIAQDNKLGCWKDYDPGWPWWEREKQQMILEMQ